MRRPEPFRIEDGCDLAIYLTQSVEFDDTLPQLVLIGVMRVALQRFAATSAR